DLKLELSAFGQAIRLAQRQEAERLAAAQVDEGAAQPRRQTRRPADDARAQAMFGSVVVSMYNEGAGAPIAEDHAPGLDRSRGKDDLDIGYQAASARQPEPRRRFATS